MPVDHGERQRRWPVILSHREQLLIIARARTTCDADAEDCVQEALTRAAVHPGLDLAKAGAFLTTTTIRLTVDLHRDRSRQARLQARVEGQASLTDDHAEEIADRSLARWLAGQAQALSVQEQAVLHARLAGASSRDAASTLGISVRAAESSLTRVRQKLQTAWTRVAAVVAGLGVVLRRHTAVSLPLTALAAAVSLGPLLLLPATGTDAPSHAPYGAPALYAAPPQAVNALAEDAVRPNKTKTPTKFIRAATVSRPLTEPPQHDWGWGWPRTNDNHDCQDRICHFPLIFQVLGQGVKEVWHPDGQDGSGQHAAHQRGGTQTPLGG